MSKTTKRSHDPRWSKIVRDLTMHPARSALVILSIAVGVFSIVMVLGGQGILQETFETNFPLSESANAVLYTGDFGDLVYEQAARQDGVRAAEARRSVVLRYRKGDLREAADPVPGATQAERSQSIDLIASKDWDLDRLDKVFPAQGVEWPPATGQVVLEQSAKLVSDLQPGDTITLDLGDGEKRALKVAGFAHDINAPPAMFVNRLVGYVTMDSLGELEQPDAYNQLVVSFDDSRLSRDIASESAAKLRDDVLTPAGVEVFGSYVPEPGSHWLNDIYGAIVVLLEALGVMALLLSGFLVVNTVSALVTQQTKQIGIMKAVGASAFQVTRMYLLLVSAFGLIGVIIGLPMGLWWAAWFADFANGLLNFGSATGTVPAYVWALGLAVGILVPVLAAWIPVRRGSRMPVVSALRQSGMGDTAFGHSFTDRLLGLVKGLPRPVALSLRNTFLRKGRLAMTLATLTLASVVVMAVISVRSSMLKTVDDMSSWWGYDVEMSMQRPVPESTAQREALRVPGVESMEGWVIRSASMARSDGSERESIRVVGLPADTTFIKPRIADGRWLKVDDEDSIVINTDLANDEDLEVGDIAKLKIQGAEREWKVVGIVPGQLQGAGVYANRTHLEDVLGDPGAVGRIVVRTTRGTDSFQKQTADRLEDRFKKAGLPLAEIDTTRQKATTISNELGLIVVFLVIMATILAIVAVIGLSGTMIINVLESTREIGVMRAIGASHADIFQVFVTEGIVVGVLAWAFGVAFTFPLSYSLVRMLESAIKIPLSYEFSWQGVLGWLALVMAISAVASLLPAWRAAQVSVRDAIAYE